MTERELQDKIIGLKTENERLRTALHDLRKAYIFWVGDKGDGEALARANALLDGAELFTRDQWFTLPMELRHRWWRETDYGNKPPSQSLIAAITKEINRSER